LCARAGFAEFISPQDDIAGDRLAIHRESGIQFHQFFKFREEFSFSHNCSSDHEINPCAPFKKGPGHERHAGVEGAGVLMHEKRLE
jgi:hypothetical protein